MLQSIHLLRWYDRITKMCPTIAERLKPGCRLYRLQSNNSADTAQSESWLIRWCWLSSNLKDACMCGLLICSACLPCGQQTLGFKADQCGTIISDVVDQSLQASSAYISAGLLHSACFDSTQSKRHGRKHKAFWQWQIASPRQGTCQILLSM